jgi:hypothetical protein
MSPTTDNLRPRLDALQRNALICAVIGIVVIVILGLRDSQQFFRSYLFSFIFWICMPLGCMAVLMLHHLTGGRWGLPIRRIMEAGSRTIGLMAVLFLPILFGMKSLYLWANAAIVQNDAVLQQKRWWLNPTGFVVRCVIYFALWWLIAGLLNKWSREQDATGNPELADRMERLSAPGVVIWGFLLTGASIDWVMSLEPHWYSTIYGLMFIVIAALAGFSFTIFILRMLSDYPPVKDSVAPNHYNDLGNILLAFVMLWAYLSFSQLLIIWAGNLKEEIPWYVQRAFGGWAPIGVALVVFHFFVPFLLLLQRGVKKRLRTLSFVSGWIVVLSLLDVYWIVVPSWDKAQPHFHLSDIFALLGIGGLWVAAFAWQLKRLPLLPLHDPRFEGVLLHEHAD